METFSALLALCVGNSPVAGEFPIQRPVTRNFDVFFTTYCTHFCRIKICSVLFCSDVFFVLRLKTRLSKHWWDWCFETPSCPLWRHCNELAKILSLKHWKKLWWKTAIWIAQLGNQGGTWPKFHICFLNVLLLMPPSYGIGFITFDSPRGHIPK